MRQNAEPPEFSLSLFLLGVISSALVMWLFINIQKISDMAPALIKNSSMPGLLGGVIATLSVGWIIFVCRGFVAPILRGARCGHGITRPGSFVLGAFISLAAVLGAIRYFEIGLFK